MSDILAIDAGTRESGYCLLTGAGTVFECAKLSNQLLIEGLADAVPAVLVLEQPALYQKLSSDMVWMIRWMGRFEQEYRLVAGPGGEVVDIPRSEVVKHLAGGQRKGADATIRAALIERWGGKEKAIGRKAAPGPLHGVKADAWQALALAVTYLDLHAGPAYRSEEEWRQAGCPTISPALYGKLLGKESPHEEK